MTDLKKCPYCNVIKTTKEEYFGAVTKMVKVTV